MSEGKKKVRIAREDARQMLFDMCVPVGAEPVSLNESYGRVLAEDIIAKENIPPFAKAPLDGYALRGEDTAAASLEHPVTLEITEEIAAGDVPRYALQPGYAAKILTGAPIPEGANAVVRYEETQYTDTHVTFVRPVSPNSNVVPVGDDIACGRVIARKGEIVTPPIAGLLAALGQTEVCVHTKPSICVISTGSELTGPETKLPEGKIRNSSYHLLKGYMEQAGAQVSTLGIVPDDVDTIAQAISTALESADMVVTTGGVSVGDYDLVMAATEQIGARRLFWKVRFRPGGTMLAAEKDGKLILGLSGNPASASLALHIIGIPYIKALGGQSAKAPERIKARLLEPIQKDSPHGRLVRGRMVIREGEVCFSGVDSQGNGALSSLLGCDLVADIPPETPPLPAGTIIDAYRI